MCSSGNRPAQATANSVIASAKRLIDVRHSWRNSSRIAEILGHFPYSEVVHRDNMVLVSGTRESE